MSLNVYVVRVLLEVDLASGRREFEWAALRVASASQGGARLAAEGSALPPGVRRGEEWPYWTRSGSRGAGRVAGSAVTLVGPYAAPSSPSGGLR